MSVAPTCRLFPPFPPCSCSSTGVMCGNLFLLSSFFSLSLSLVTLHLICSSWFICLSFVFLWFSGLFALPNGSFILSHSSACVGVGYGGAGQWPWAVSYVGLISSSLISVVCCWLYLFARYHFDCQPEGGINVVNFISRIRCSQSAKTNQYAWFAVIKLFSGLAFNDEIWNIPFPWILVTFFQHYNKYIRCDTPHKSSRTFIVPWQMFQFRILARKFQTESISKYAQSAEKQN